MRTNTFSLGIVLLWSSTLYDFDKHFFLLWIKHVVGRAQALDAKGISSDTLVISDVRTPPAKIKKGCPLTAPFMISLRNAISRLHAGAPLPIFSIISSMWLSVDTNGGAMMPQSPVNLMCIPASQRRLVI